VIEQIAASEIISKLKWYVKQLLQIENNNSEWLYDLFKFDLGLVSDEELIKYSVPLGTLPEFNELLPNLNTKYQELVIQILNKQTQLIKQYEEQNKAEKERLEKERIRQEIEAERRRQEREEKEKREKEERERETLLKKMEDESNEKADKGIVRTVISLILFGIWYIIIFYPLINEDFDMFDVYPIGFVISFINVIHCIFSIKYLKYLNKTGSQKLLRILFWFSFIFSTFWTIYSFIILNMF
jgi:Fe2+ transport system protein B